LFEVFLELGDNGREIDTGVEAGPGETGPRVICSRITTEAGVFMGILLRCCTSQKARRGRSKVGGIYHHNGRVLVFKEASVASPNSRLTDICRQILHMSFLGEMHYDGTFDGRDMHLTML
jgi:hypothetical protein